MKLFVTSDIPAYECADPPLEPSWREAVGSDDLVYVLVGEIWPSILPRLDILPGRKQLVSGVRALEGGFLLSALPLHPSQIGPGEINLHGKPIRPIGRDPTRLCVSLEATGFRPVPLDEARHWAAAATRSAAPALIRPPRPMVGTQLPQAAE